MNIDSDYRRNYCEFSSRRGMECGIRCPMEGNFIIELKKRLSPSGATFLSAEMNCVLPWKLWVTSPFLINSFRSLLFPRKCQHFKIWHFKRTRAFSHQIKSMLIKISIQNVTKISETNVSTCFPQLQQTV